VKSSTVFSLIKIIKHFFSE